MLGSGEGVSGRDTGLLSSFSGIGRRPAGLEEMVVYVDGKFCVLNFSLGKESTHFSW